MAEIIIFPKAQGFINIKAYKDTKIRPEDILRHYHDSIDVTDIILEDENAD